MTEQRSRRMYRVRFLTLAEYQVDEMATKTKAAELAHSSRGHRYTKTPFFPLFFPCRVGPNFTLRIQHDPARNLLHYTSQKGRAYHPP